MNKHSAVIIFTCLYVSGIIAFSAGHIPVFALLLLISAVYFLFFSKTLKSKYIMILLSAFAAGIFNAGFNIKYDDSIAPYADKDITAQARVVTIPSNSIKDRTKFYALIKSAEYDGGAINAENAKILVTINDEPDKISNIKIGDTIKLKGRLKQPAYAQNPSQFDYAKYLRYRKTFSLMYVSDSWEIVKHADDFTGRLLSAMNDRRERILKIHAQNIKSPMLEILGGIIFGDDAVNPDEETKTSFINSGIFHILAASGMNVTLIFGIWFFIASRLKFNYKLSTVLGMMLILFYTFMTGFGAPVIRAAIMLLLILAGRLIDREADTMSLLFAAAFLMLLFNPLMLFDIGFQLSFIVTFALILTAPLINFKFKNKYVNNAIGACFIPLIAQLYAAPLQMYYFNTFTPYSVFANIAVIPVLSVISFAGFISSMAAAVIPAVSLQVCFIADLILNPFLIYIVKIAGFFANLPDAVLVLKKPALFQILLYYAVITGLICIMRFKIKGRKIKAAFIAVSAAFILSFIPLPDKNPEILYFSTGNADSFLVKAPDGSRFMIDTAKTGYNGSNTPAKNIMLKYMKDKGINELKALILSHFDSDHAGGTIDVLKEINVQKLYITDVYEDTELSENIQKYALENNIKSEIIADTKEIYNKNGFRAVLIKPEGALIKTENQKSLAAYFSINGFNFLFTGDGDVNSYASIPDEFKKNITAAKSGHHGAKNTVNKEMADNSKLFILSTGHNPYNHPNPETIKTISDNGRDYLRTDRHNAVRAVIKRNKAVIQCYSPARRKFETVYTFKSGAN